MSVLLPIIGWIVSAALFAVVICDCARHLARRPSPPVDDQPESVAVDEDWLADQPAEVVNLTDDEVERRFARLAGWVEP